MTSEKGSTGDKMICGKCGKQFGDNVKFCPQCGQPTGGPQTYVPQTGGQQTNVPQMGGQQMNVPPANAQQSAGMGAGSASPNAYYAGGVNYPGYNNPAGNANGQQAPKKNYAVPIVIASVAAVIVIVVGVVIASRFLRSDGSPQGGTETGGLSASLPTTSDTDPGNVPDTEPEGDDMDSSQESVDELLGYIDQAEEVLSKAYDELAVLEEKEYYTGKFREYAVVLEKLTSDLTALKGQAGAVSGLDANVENAGREYFNMMCDSQEAFYEIWNFMADYFDFGENTLFYRPEWEDYDSIENYYNDLYAWYQATKEEYEAITSCPSCMESEWRKLGETLDLNESISYKLYLANGYVDYLRAYSALNMSDRYITMEELQYDGFLKCLAGEKDHCQNQRSMASRLADEIHAYAGMGKERAGYEFEYVRTGKIIVDYEAVDTIYPSLYNTYDAFLIVKTGCISGTRKIVVEAEITGLTQTYKESFTLDSAYREIYIKPPALAGDLDLSAAKNAQLKVTISEMDGALIEAKTFPVTIKSKYDFEWYSDEYGVATKDNILCFLTPESEAIAGLKRQAISEISSMTNGNMESFVGYQNNRWNNHYVGTYLQAAGIMRALYEMGVRYNMDTFSISGSNQHILFPDDVLNQQSGLCIETSLVVASALQSAGMHAFLVFPPGHAQVAVEVWNGSGSDTTGTGEYLLIETTALSGSSNNEDIFVSGANALLDYNRPSAGPITYYSQDEWLEYISGDTYVIDCNDSSVLGMTPFAN